MFDRCNNIGTVNVKIDGTVLDGKPSFKMLGLSFSSELDWCSYIISIDKTASKKISHDFDLMALYGIRLSSLGWNC